MKTHVNIQFEDTSLLQDMFGTIAVKEGEKVAIDDNCRAVVDKYTSYRSQELSQFLELVLSWSIGLGSGVAANWLYDRIKGKNVKVSINHREIEIDRNKIRAAFTEIEER
jgi:hypothetical protein